jgi:uncharacterized membrane protein
MRDRVALAAITAGYVAGAFLYLGLPTLDDASGRIPADARLFIGSILPIAASTIYLVFASLWRSDPSIGSAMHARAQRGIRRCLVLFTIALHGLLVASLAGVTPLRAAAPRLGVVLFGLLLVGVGNLLPQTRPNLVVGIRTSRTLGDRRLWMRIHRVGGYATVAVGIVLVFSGLFLSRVQIAQAFHTAAFGAALALLVSYRRHAHV